VFKSKVLRRERVFGHKKELPGGGRILRNEELHNLCSSSHIVWVVKSRRDGQHM
jgi:hypothetical protein